MKKNYLNDFLAEPRFVSCHSIFSYISYKDFFSYLSESVFIAGLYWSHLSTEPCPSSQREAYSFWFTAVSSSKTLEVHSFLKWFYLLEFLENILSCRNPLLRMSWKQIEITRTEIKGTEIASSKYTVFLDYAHFSFYFPIERHTLKFHIGKIFLWKL